MNNTTKERNLKLNELFNSSLTVEQVIKEVLKETTDFAYFFVFSANSIDNENYSSNTLFDTWHLL